MKKLIILVYLSFPLFLFSQEIQISETLLKKHIQYLSSDRMQGRQTGSKQVAKAGKYIEKYFKKMGLKPKGVDGYKQKFVAKVKKVVISDSLKSANNIIGFLDNGASKTIVIGAHYDHIGHGEFGNSKDDKENIGKIHNGADDNASGVAGLLELVRYFSQNKIKEDCNILFIAFCGEELGLYGSKYFVENPTIPLGSIHWMLNMDMIGRYTPENKLGIIGYGTSHGFAKAFQGIHSDILYNLSKDGRGGSDQTSFYDKKIPVLFFHTYGHPDYHKHTDDWEKINFPAMVSILNIEKDVVIATMKIPEMEFVWTN